MDRWKDEGWSRQQGSAPGAGDLGEQRQQCFWHWQLAAIPGEPLRGSAGNYFTGGKAGLSGKTYSSTCTHTHIAIPNSLL